MSDIKTTDNVSLEEAQIAQVELLGQDLLLAFSNGASILVDGERVKRLALNAPKKIVNAHDSLDGIDGDGDGHNSWS